MADDNWPDNRRVTVLDIQAAKARKDRWAMLTSYDALTARVFEDANVRVLLVGDSAAMTVLGHDTTVPVTLDAMITLAGGVVRGTERALVVGDLPFGSYQASVEQAVASSTRYFKEAGVGAVKLEGGQIVCPQVRAIVAAGMPVMAHVGLTPQSFHALGGNKVQGRGEAADRLVADALALQEAGAFAIVLEAIPAGLAERVTAQLDIPTIGIGAGPCCDAQVLVWQDMAGLTTGKGPKFVKRYADVRGQLLDAAGSFVAEVNGGSYPGPQHQYN